MCSHTKPSSQSHPHSLSGRESLGAHLPGCTGTPLARPGLRGFVAWRIKEPPSAQRTLPLEGSGNGTPGLRRKSLCGPRWVCAHRGSHTTPPVPTPPPARPQFSYQPRGLRWAKPFHTAPPHTHHSKRVSLPLSPPGSLGPPTTGVGGAISPGCLWAVVPQMPCSVPDIVVIWTFHIKVIN